MKKKIRTFIEKGIEIIKKYILYFLKHYYFVTLLAIGCLVIFIACPQLISGNNYELIKNLMFSYLGAFIFFILISYYPERKRAMKCRIEVMPILERVYADLSYIIALINYELSKLSQDTNEICGVTYDNEDRFADICYFKGDEYISNVRGWYYRVHEDLYKNCFFIYEMLNDILSLPCFVYCDVELVMLLSDLKESVFLKRIMKYSEIYKIEKEYNMKHSYIMNRTDVEFNRLKAIYNKMTKHVVEKRHYIFYDISDSEVESIKSFFKETEDINIESSILIMELNKKYEN